MSAAALTAEDQAIAAARALHTLIVTHRQPASATPRPLEIEFTARIDDLGEALKVLDPAYDPKPPTREETRS